MKQKNDVYICSKPLQFFNIKNIGKIEVTPCNSILVIIDGFQNAKEYADRIRMYDDYWNEVVFLKRFADCYRWLLKRKIRNLYVDNDMSWFFYGMSFFNRINNLYVYEEGIGTYANMTEYEEVNLCRKSSWARRLGRKLMGMGLHIGDSRYCKGVYLTKPYLYNSKFCSTKGRGFVMSFLDNLQKNEELFLRLTGGLPEELEVSEKSILIYVTDWNIQSEILSKLFKESPQYDICFIKPHPHIKQIEIKEDSFVKVLNTPVMMELVISYLLKRNNRITIWHQYSTSVVHFLDHIESVPFPINPEYERVYNEYINA